MQAIADIAPTNAHGQVETASYENENICKYGFKSLH